MTDQPGSSPLTVAVVTGDHSFDVVGFHHLFRGFPEMDCYIQHLDDWAANVAGWRHKYDVVVFYNMHSGRIGEGQRKGKQRVKEAMEQLGDTEQGIIVLHHGILAFRDDPLWDKLVGIPQRAFGFFHGERLRIEIAHAAHPLTQGLRPFEIVDETYTMDDAGADSEIVLETNHPRSMRTIGWTRQYKNSRVFCLELGHDNVAWSNPGFREVLGRGLKWCARSI